MKSNGTSIVLALATLLLLAVLRAAGASAIMAAVPSPYGAGIISALGVLMAIAVAILLDRLIRFLYWDGYLRRKRKLETPALIEDLLTIALIVLGASIGLFFEAGVSFTGLLTASGATAVVLGIALQAVIQDVFSGLSLNFDGSYTIGDWLTMYSDQFPEPVYGKVEGITWRTTFLRLSDGRRMMVPNHLLTSNPVMNHSRPQGPKRLLVEIPVDNRFPMERAISILLGEAYRAVREKPLSAQPEPDIVIDKFDSDSVFFHVRFYADPDEVEPGRAKSIMASALHSAARRHLVPSPVEQVELVTPPDNFDFEATEARDALSQAPIFKDVLDGAQLDALVAGCPVRTLSGNTVFIHQGKIETSMFIILEGAARISIGIDGGRKTRDVAVLGGGDIVGEMSLMTGAPRSATVTSLTSMRVLEVTKESIEGLLKAKPGLLERFSTVLAARQLALSQIAVSTEQTLTVETDILARMRVFFARVFG